MAPLSSRTVLSSLTAYLLGAVITACSSSVTTSAVEANDTGGGGADTGTSGAGGKKTTSSTSSGGNGGRATSLGGSGGALASGDGGVTSGEGGQNVGAGSPGSGGVQAGGSSGSGGVQAGGGTSSTLGGAGNGGTSPLVGGAGTTSSLGGAVGIGGATTTGGTTTKGGSTGTGGTVIVGAGGTSPVGGAPTGGKATGGAQTGGAQPVGGAATGGAATGGAAPTCPSTHQCVPRAPTGWVGPVIYASTSSLTNCTTNYPTQSLFGGLGVTGPTSCTCNCNATPVSSSCTEVSVMHYSDSQCTNANGGGTVSFTPYCVTTDGGGTSVKLILSPPAAQCAAGTYSSLAAASFTSPMRACGGATENSGTCASTGDACLPIPPSAASAKTCVYKAGLQDCPTGYTGSSAVVFRSISDSRTCPSSCGCTGGGGTCTISRQKFSISGCTVATGGPGSITSNDTPACNSGDSFTSMQLGAASMTAPPTCTGGSSTSASGSVSGTDSVTVCCK